MNLTPKKKHKYTGLLYFLLYLFLVILFIIFLLFINSYLKVKNISVEFYDENPDNQSINDFIVREINTQANSLFNFTILNEDDFSKVVHNEFEIVENVRIAKSFGRNITVSVIKNEEYFFTCVGEDVGFLVRCMKGNIDGEYFAGMEVPEDQDNVVTKGIPIEIDTNVLYEKNTQNKISTPDSLSGARIYTLEEFKVLRELVRWVQKNGFEIKKIFVDELKVVAIETKDYVIKVSLEKGYVETVKDFEIISRTGELQKYINEDKSSIKYIDLSYKDKIFYKLKETTENDIMSTTSATTTTASTTSIER